MTFLYEKIEALREYGNITELPSYILENLNPGFELRPYQKLAFENFITHFEGRNCPKPTQVLFHMATGSGKTLIMAGLMLYLYKRGYRNFLFFVNLTNIVEKTKENFLNSTSTKYLFADEIVQGYDSGTRVRFIEDPTSEDGYRRLTKEDELEILQKEFDDIAESKFSKRQQEAAEEIAKSLESLQKILEKRGKGSVREYHPIKIPDDFLEKLLLKSRKHIANL